MQTSQKALRFVLTRFKKYGLDTTLKTAGQGFRLEQPNFLPLVVETLGSSMVSIAHYGEMNGDAMRDPDIEFWVARDESGKPSKFHPISYRNDYLGVMQEVVVDWKNGKPATFKPALQNSIMGFVRVWANNFYNQGWTTVQPTDVYGNPNYKGLKKADA